MASATDEIYNRIDLILEEIIENCASAGINGGLSTGETRTKTSMSKQPRLMRCCIIRPLNEEWWTNWNSHC
jgi:hypothetical protein